MEVNKCFQNDYLTSAKIIYHLARTWKAYDLKFSSVNAKCPQPYLMNGILRPYSPTLPPGDNQIAVVNNNNQKNNNYMFQFQRNHHQEIHTKILNHARTEVVVSDWCVLFSMYIAIQWDDSE
jgi:hypothetical protein